MGHRSSSSLNRGDRVRVRVLYSAVSEQTRPLTRAPDHASEVESSRTDTLQILSSADREEAELVLTLSEPRNVSPYEEWWVASSERNALYLLRFNNEYNEPAPVEPHINPTTLARLNLPFASGTHAGWYIIAWRHYEGPSLREWRASLPTPPSLERILPILSGIEEIMRPLHDAGYSLLHVPPDAIRITDDDFICFDHVEDIYALGQEVTGHQFRPGYVHPEFFNGRVISVATIYADIHLFAALAWFLLVGNDPPSTALTSFIPAAPLRAFLPDLAVGVAPAIESALTRGEDVPFGRPHGLLQRLRAINERSKYDHSTSLEHLQLIGETHPGIAKRLSTPINQDAIFYDLIYQTAFMLVADGVSTARFGRGDIASSILRAEAERAWRSLDDFDIDSDEDIRAWMAGIMNRANRQLIEEVNEQFAPFDGSRPLDVMATTATMALVHEGTVTLASLGDSPAYLVRDGNIERLNRDHNVMTLELARGTSPERVASLAWPDALSRCLGSYALASNGRLIPRDSEIDFLQIDLQYGDRILLCSDGIVDYIGESVAQAEDYLLELLIEEQVPSLAALEAILEANRGGGGDNLSIILLYAEEQLEPLILTSEYVVVDD